MRGARVPGAPCSLSAGIIPAGAGSTRGHIMSDRNYQGSSPQVRGALRAGVERGRDRGIIPAGAGSTRSRRRRSRRPRDHPRRCGEHVTRVSTVVEITGSSPQVRGARCRIFFCRLTLGIIPAGAGSTRCSEGRYMVLQDHPRRCGEHARDRRRR